MAFKTLSGFGISGTTGGVGSNGLIQLGTAPYASPAAASWNGLLGDFLAMARKSLLSGIIAGGVCTIATLAITIPTGTAFLAGGQYWVSDSTTQVNVTDIPTTYVWGCSDGIFRLTTDTTPPTGFDDNRSFILLKASGTGGGAATIDLSVQQKARVVSPTSRFLTENAAGIAPVADTIPLGSSVSVPLGSQLAIMDKLTISGSLTIQGKIRVQ